jgi:hypothetical protein
MIFSRIVARSKHTRAGFKCVATSFAWHQLNAWNMDAFHPDENLRAAYDAYFLRMA